MDRRIDNLIEDQIQNLPISKDISYISFYRGFSDIRIQEIFSTFHFHLINLFRDMNIRLPSPTGENHYWANQSRALLGIIQCIENFRNGLKNTEFSFYVHEDYAPLLRKCETFLKPYFGSKLPSDLKKIVIPYKIPLFLSSSSYVVKHAIRQEHSELKHLGEGSYAHVYLYHDSFYNRDFILKRAKKNLSDKERQRFKQEFDTMQGLKSPYIVEVYKYNAQPQEYIMEKMDYTLEEFIRRYSTKITKTQRKNLILQIYKSFLYIHKKELLHRDISPRNILVKQYDDGTFVVKIADFGLVHIPNSTLTTMNTEWKGYYNDPELRRIGFDHYEMSHEIFALTCVTGFVLTGKTNFSSLSDKTLKDFLDKGMNPDKNFRYKSVLEMRNALNNI